MKRIYRLLVTVRIEGDPETVPTVSQLMALVRELIRDKDDHDLEARASFIECEDEP